MLFFSRLVYILPLLFQFCLSASILFQHATIITYNDTLQDFHIYTNASMLIEKDRITRLANETTIPASSTNSTNATVIDATGKIISPGFINTHTHLWQTAYKTLGSNTTLAQYFQRYGEFSQAEQYYQPEDTYLGQLTGCLELIHEGTTTVLDHAHGDFSIDTANAEFNATWDSGIRAFYAHTIHDIPNNWPKEEQLGLFDTWGNQPRVQNSDALVKLGLASDTFYTAPRASVSALLNATQRHNLSVVTTHNLDGPWSIGNSPEVLDRLGWLNHSFPVIFSHSSFATQTDYSILRSTNHYISTTPESEQHFGHVHPWSHNIQDQAALGSDCTFTYSGGMVQQARSWMQSMREVNYAQHLVADLEISRNNPMSVKQAFHLITRAGGLALRRDDLGAIAEGAKADIVVFDGTSPNMLGWWDPIAALILHSNTGDIEHVLIDGKFVKRDGKLVFPDYACVQQRFMKSAKRIQNLWLNTDWPALGEFWEGNFSRIVDSVTIDTQRGDGTGY